MSSLLRAELEAAGQRPLATGAVATVRRGHRGRQNGSAGAVRRSRRRYTSELSLGE